MANITLPELVHLYRELGFFADLAELSDAEAADRLLERYRSTHTSMFEPNFLGVFGDLVLLSLDEDRIWWMDLEADVFAGENAYVRILGEWARISRGAFQPEDVQERWSDDGEPPIIVTFKLGGREHQLDAGIEEWIDLDLLNQINRLISSSGYAFTADIRTEDQTAAVVVLTKAERARLDQERPSLFFTDQLEEMMD